MSFWDKIKDLKGLLIDVDVSLPKLEKVCLVDNSKNHKYQIKVSGKNLVIENPQLLDKKTRAIVEDIIIQNYKEKEEILIDSAEKTIYSAKNEISTDSNKEILSFFSGRISSKDYSLIGACLYLRLLFKQGDSIKCSEIKHQITTNHGKKGSNLSNLCTAGYLESNIIATLKEMDKPDRLSNERFQSLFDELVLNFPLAVFVNGEMSKENAVSMVVNQITINRENGIAELAIHGINSRNIKLVRSIVLELKEKGLFLVSHEEIIGSAIKVLVKL